jgi:type IV pilus assembly protein PilO
MDALLSDINQAGLGRGLQFELFRPGQVEVKDYYAELPIAIKVSGRYNDMGSFAADVANLSRIVTLHNLAIAPANARDTSGALSMEATARTYRYLDANEVAEQQRIKAEKAKAAGAKK